MEPLTERSQQTTPNRGRLLDAARLPLPRLRTQLVAVGLVAVVLHVAVVATAVEGLHEVEAAHADVTDIVRAQRHFQDADMAHDAVRADTLMLLVEADRAGGRLPDGHPGLEALAADVEDFRTDLDLVDRVPLPSELAAAVRQVRPLQEAYVADAELLGAHVRAGETEAAQEVLLGMEAKQQQMVTQQGVVTELMSDEAGTRRAVALQDERHVRWRITLSAAAALLGLIGLTLLLNRLGRTVTRLLARERDVAETLQQRLLPDTLPELAGVRFAARYRPGTRGAQVGGDWYDVIELPGGRVGLVMGDVVGHDLDAAASMGQLRNALRAYAADGDEPDEVLTRLNRLSLQHGFGDMASLLYAVLDPVTGTIDVANAGHYPPLLATATGHRYLQAPPCPPVGAVRETRYTRTRYELPAGSRLLMFTDGLVECRGLAVEDGLQQLSTLVGPPWGQDGPRDEGHDLERVCDDVLEGMLPTGSEDDVALLVVARQALLGRHVELVWPAEADRLSALRQVLLRWLREVGADEEEAYDIVVACSEAATNAVEHAYGPARADFRVVCDVSGGSTGDRGGDGTDDRAGDVVTVVVRDWGSWREARGRDRGRGRGLMAGLMDDVDVTHGDKGTQVRLTRRLRGASGVRPAVPRMPVEAAT